MLTLLVWNHFLILTATCSSFLGAPHLGSRDGARTGQGHRLEPREGGTARGRMPMQMGTSAGSLTSSEATEVLCRVPVISIQRGGLIDYRVPEALSGNPSVSPTSCILAQLPTALWEEKGTCSAPSSSAHPKPRWAERGCPRLLRLGAHIFILNSSLSFAHLTCCAPLCSDSQSQLAKTCRAYSCPVSSPNPIEGWSLP